MYLSNFQPPQITAICDALGPRYLATLIRGCSDYFCEVLKNLIPEQIKALCEVLGQERLTALISHHVDFTNVFLYLTTAEQRTAFYRAFGPQNVAALIEDALGFYYTSRVLTVKEMKEVCDVLKPEGLASLIDETWVFNLVLPYLTAEQGTALYQSRQKQSPSVMSNIMKELKTSHKQSVLYAWMACQAYAYKLNAELPQYQESDPNFMLMKEKLKILQQAQALLTPQFSSAPFATISNDLTTQLMNILQTKKENSNQCILLIPRATRTASFFRRTVSDSGSRFLDDLQPIIPKIVASMAI